jgi:hypothetical protein
MFDNTLTLYDFIMIRNRYIIPDFRVNIQAYLTGNYTEMSQNIMVIRKVYEKYAEHVKRWDSKKFMKENIVFPTKFKPAVKVEDPAEEDYSPRKKQNQNILDDSDAQDKPDGMFLNHRYKKNYVWDPEKIDESNLEEVKLIETGKNVFINLLTDDEFVTKGYTLVTWRIVLKLVLEVIVSNWNVITYILMLLYTF